MASNGIYPDELVLVTVNCKYSGNSGDLVVTDKGLVFIKADNMFGGGRERLHTIRYEEIDDLKIESAFLGVQLAVRYHTPSGESHKNKYACSQGDAEKVIRTVAERRNQARPVSRPASAVEPHRDVIRETTIREVILVVCPHCGHRNDSANRKCEHCGASI